MQGVRPNTEVYEINQTILYKKGGQVVRTLVIATFICITCAGIDRPKK